MNDSFLHRPTAVRVFPVKAYAFVNYADIGSAIKAMQAVDGLAIPQLTGARAGAPPRRPTAGQPRPRRARRRPPWYPALHPPARRLPTSPPRAGVKPLVMRYQQESGSASSTPKPPGSAGSAASLLPRAASEAALAALGLNQLVPGASLASLLTGGHHPAATAPPGVGAPAAAASADASSSDDGLMPVPNLSNK